MDTNHQPIPWGKYALIFTSTFLLDRITKFLALQYLHERIEIDQVLSLKLVIQWDNSMIRLFHVGKSIVNNPFFLMCTLLSFVGIMVLHAYLMRNRAGINAYSSALAMSAMLCIVIDRLVYHGTIGFLVFWNLPAISCADIGMTGALILLVIETIRSQIVQED